MLAGAAPSLWAIDLSRMTVISAATFDADYARRYKTWAQTRT
jgi:hypothetical protein